MTTAEPGWYEDPEDSAQRRWWDGSAWTNYREPADSGERASSARSRVGPALLIGVAVAAAALILVQFGSSRDSSASKTATQPAAVPTPDLLDTGTFEGELLWQLDTGLVGKQHILGHSDNIMVVSGTCAECDRELRIVGIDRERGRRMWERPIGALDPDAIAGRIVGHRVVAIAVVDGDDPNRGELIGLDLESGAEEWQTDLAPVSSSRWKSGHGVEVVLAKQAPDSELPGIVVIDSVTGAVRFSHPAELPGPLLSLALRDDLLVVADLDNTDRTPESTGARLVAYDLDGNRLWQRDQRLSGRVLVEDIEPSAPRVVVAPVADGLAGIDAATGDELWALDLLQPDGKLFGWVDGQRNQVVTCSSHDGPIVLAGFDLETGEELWTQQVRRDDGEYQSAIGGWVDDTDIFVTFEPANECTYASGSMSLGPPEDEPKVRVMALDTKSGSIVWSDGYTTADSRYFSSTTNLSQLTVRWLTLNSGENSDWILIDPATGKRDASFVDLPVMPQQLGDDLGLLYLEEDAFRIESTRTGKSVPLTTPFVTAHSFYDGVRYTIDILGQMIAID